MPTIASVFAAGLLVGLAELLSRHRDYPAAAAWSWPSAAYLALNGTLSIIALFLVRLSPPQWLMNGTGPDIVKTTLFVGFGAAAFFRSSFFKVRTTDGELSVGPGLIIEVFLRVIDDAVDRKLGARRLDDASTIMSGVNFSKAAKALPTYCFSALKRLSPDAQQQAAIQIKAIEDATGMDERTKAVALGQSIMALTGRTILEKAVGHLGDSIK